VTPDRAIDPHEARGAVTDEDAAQAAASSPDVPEGEAVVPGEEHDRVVAERDEYLDGLRRLKAEFDNFRKRTERERQSAAAAAALDLVADLLPVMDNLERAVSALGGQDAGVVAGVDMVRGQLAALLFGRGVREIETAEREAFDPTVQEAVSVVSSPDHPEGTVVAVVQKGYRLDEGTVLRPARVVVAGPQG
jgi:molecular chaperone GrpE